MGKRLISQRRGKASTTFKAKLKGIKASYSSLDSEEKERMVLGEVTELIKESGRNSVLANVMLENGHNETVIAAEGLNVGQKIEQGQNANVEIGNVLFLKSVPEGCPVFNIEKIPGDGGSIAKSTGTYGFIVTKDTKKAFVKLSSGKTIKLSLGVRATVGNAAGGGRKEKPFIKAGNRWHAFKARSRNTQKSGELQ